MKCTIHDLEKFQESHKLESFGDLSKWELGISEMIIFTPFVYRCFIYKIDIVSNKLKYISIGNFQFLQDAQEFMKKFGELFNICEIKLFTPKHSKE